MRRHELAAVRHERVETRHLQGRHLDVLLPDRELNRVPGLPQAFDLPRVRIGLLRVRLLAPLDRRHEPCLFRPDVEPGRLTEAKGLRPALERLAPVRREVVEQLPHLVEVGVAGLRNRCRHRHRLVRVRVPVVEGVPVDDEAAGALKRVVRREDVLLHRGESGHGLEGRAGRIDARDGAVQRREVRLLGGAGVEQRGELALLAGCEDVRVVARVGRERADCSIARVEGDDCAGRRVPVVVRLGAVDAVDDRLLRGPLELRVERQPDRIAGIGNLLHLGRALRSAERVDAQLREPGPPAQLLVERGLDASLADRVPERVAAELLQLQLRDRADVAHQLGGEVAEAVLPDERVRDSQARELRLVLQEVENLVLAGELLQGHQGDRVAAVLLDLARDVRQRDVEDVGEAPQLCEGPVPREIGRPDLDGGPGLVVDEDAAVPVLDRPARGLLWSQSDLVVLGHLEELVPGEDLEGPEPEEEDGERGEDEEAEDADPEDGLRRELAGLDHDGVAGEAIRALGAWVGREEAARPVGAYAASQRTRPPGAGPADGRGGGRVRRPGRRAGG